MYLKHGMSNTPEYKCWQQFKSRCLNPNHRAYPDYGGRGITVHEAWIHDFLAFYEHVGPRPSLKHSLDRIDNTKGYEPGNVRWVTVNVQMNNRRPHRKHGERPPRRPVADRVTNTKHGMTGTTEYKSWYSMKTRCLNPNDANYARYGARGITIYEPWKTDFQAFYDYMGPKPGPSYSLDRIDNSKGYEPGNVRWASKAEQSQNRGPYVTGEGHGNYAHGLTKASGYKAWGSIKTRCYNTKHDGHANYGAQGITMCERWKESAQAFIDDLGEKPSKKHMVVRLDHTLGYCCGKCAECLENRWPSNCEWGTRTDANRNRKTTARTGKLTMEKAEQIRAKLASGSKYGEIAEEYGIGISLIAKIRARLIWA